MTEPDAAAREVMAQFVDADSALVAVVVDSAGAIEYCNEGLRVVLDRESRPLGQALDDFLVEDSAQRLKALEPTDLPREMSISFRTPAGALFVRCSLVASGQGILLMASRKTLSNDESLRRMSALTNELTNLNRELQLKNHELEAAQATIKVLDELIPICSFCKNVRDDKGYWEAVETYITKHSDARFSHSLCEKCAREHYPEFMPDES